jgi:hypothetical protein
MIPRNSLSVKRFRVQLVDKPDDHKTMLHSYLYDLWALWMKDAHKLLTIKQIKKRAREWVDQRAVVRKADGYDFTS